MIIKIEALCVECGNIEERKEEIDEGEALDVPDIIFNICERCGEGKTDKELDNWLEIKISVYMFFLDKIIY